MKAVEFCYWLQGVFEVCDPKQLDAKQTDLIKRHLNLVFIHEIDPSYPEDQQKLLNETHNGPPTSYLTMTNEELDNHYGPGIRPRC